MFNTEKKIKFFAFYSKSKCLFSVALFSIASILLTANAQAAICTPISGSSDRNYDLSTIISNPNNNYAGYTTELNKTHVGSVMVKCSCTGSIDTTYRSYVTTLPTESSDGQWQYLNLNEYLSGAMRITDTKFGDTYPPINYRRFGPFSVPCNEFGVQDNILTFKIKIKKPFVGVTTIPTRTIFTVYGTTTNSDPLQQPLYTISYGGTITVPQNCIINAGNIVTIDFGNISSGAFRTPRGKADGVNPISRTFAIKCNNIAAQANLTLRVQADSTSGNAIVSDNKDVGFIVTDENNREITPNVMSSVIPFKLDDNASANVTIKAFPVSVTGNKPTEGFVTSSAYLRVDFA